MLVKKIFIFFLSLFILTCQSFQKEEKREFYYTDEKKEKELWNEVLIQTERKNFERARVLIQRLPHKNKPENLKVLGNYYEKIQDYSRALEIYKLAYNVQKDIEVGLTISKLFALLGDTEQAISFLEKLKQDFRGNSEVLIQLGVLYKTTQPEVAEKIFQELLEQDSKNEKLNLHYLDSLLLQKKYEHAADYLQSIKNKTFSKEFLYLWEIHFQLERAKTAIQKKDFSTAIQSLSVAYDLDAENEELGYELVNLLCENREFSRAEKVITEMKDLEWKFLALGIYFFHKNDLEQSLEYLQQGYQTYSSNSEYPKQLGNFFFFLGDLKKAKTYFHEARNKNPYDSLTSFQLGLIAIEENLLELAEREFQKAQKLGDVNSKNFLLVLKILKTNNESEILSLEAQIKNQDLSEWKEIFFKLVGNFFYKRKNFLKAKIYYKTIVEENPNSFYALLKLFEIAQLERNFKVATQYEKLLLSLVQNDSEKKKLYLKVKNKFLNLKQKKLAISKSFLRYATPQEIMQMYLMDSKESLFEILEYLEEIGERKKGLEILKMLNQSNPEFAEIVGVYLWKVGEKLKALEMFENLKKINNNFFIEYNLGFIYLESNPQRALEHFFNSLSMNSDYYFIYLGIAKAYFLLKDYEKSKEYLGFAKEKFGDTELVLFNLGLLELETGNYTSARKIFLQLKKKYNTADSLYGLALISERENHLNLAKRYLIRAIKKEEKIEYFEKLIQITKDEDSEEIENYKIYFQARFPNSFLVKKFIHQEDDLLIYKLNLQFHLNNFQILGLVENNLFFIKNSKLYCIDVFNSNPKWSYEFSEDILRTHIIFSGVLVYTSSKNLFFFDLLSGELLWRRKLFISHLENIDGVFSAFLIVQLESGIRKLYKLSQTGNILNDLVLDKNELILIDQLENIYLLKEDSNLFNLFELKEDWISQKLKVWMDKVQVLATGRKGLYLKTMENLELISKGKIQNLGTISFENCFEFEEEFFCKVQKKFFSFSSNWSEVQSKTILQRLKFFTCNESKCLEELLAEKNLPFLLKKGKFFLFEMRKSKKH